MYSVYAIHLGSETYLDDGIADLGTRHDGIRSHHTVGILLANLGDQERAHTRTSSASKRVGNLEACRVTISKRAQRVARDITSRSR